MSLSYQRLNTVQVLDPRLDIHSKRDYAILRSGSEVSNKVFTTTTISASNIQFSCPPPSNSVVIDRKFWLTLPVRLTFTGPGTNTINLLQAARDAPRSFPLSSAIETLKVSINNSSVSINMSDVIQALMHYNTDLKLKKSDYSMTPTYQDQSQAYADLVGSVRNPLGFYGDSNDEVNQGRGGFSFTVIQNTPTAAVVDMVITEPLFLSPLYWGSSNGAGLTNISTVDISITFVNGVGNKMWSHDNSLGTNVISSIAAQFNQFAALPAPFSYSKIQPEMLFTYITPNSLQIIPKDLPLSYPYFDIQRYITDQGVSIAAGSQNTLTTNNIQLNSIPRRMYIYARQPNSILLASPNETDTYLAIENISINFENKQGVLSQSSKQQLYEMSVKNHCNMSWTQWSGDKVNQTGSLVAANQISGIGSILCVEFGTDIALDELSAPGLLGTYQLQLNLGVKNIASVAIVPSLYVVIVSEGVFCVPNLGNAVTEIGVISKNDILHASRSPFVNYKTVEHVNGGNFLSGLKDFGMKLHDFVKENKLLSKGLSKIPHPVAQTASKFAETFGYGEGVLVDEYGNEEGGVLVGGKRMSRADLRKRLMKKY